jgi:hypothetical protein
MTTETVSLRRAPGRWAWCGVAAGAAGIVANLLCDDQGSLTKAEKRSGAEVIDQLHRTTYHVGVVSGLVVVVLLIVVSAGWRRWADAERRDDLVAAAIPSALLVSAAALLVGYGFRGRLAEYLPGGINAGSFPKEGLYVLFMINDNAPWFGWWGVIAAAALCGVLSFRQRVLPVWLGVVSAVAVAVPLLLLATTGGLALAGLFGPVWLLIVSLVVALRGLPSAPATSSPVDR